MNECEKQLRRVLKSSPTVKFMLDALASNNCDFDSSRISCIEGHNPEEQMGGYNPFLKQVSVYCNQRLSYSVVQELLVHELIHALDHCTTSLSFDNCSQIACTEIRASALSGDCGFINEFLRGNFNLKGGLQKCAKRRAELSLNCLPSCKKDSANIVDSVFEQCFKDTFPFDKLP